jgi:hypothetical protein
MVAAQPAAIEQLHGRLVSLLLDRFCPSALPQPHSRPTAIVIDELDAGRFQRTANGQIIRRRYGGVLLSEFGAPYGAQTYGGSARKILRCPSDKRPGSSDLRASQSWFSILTHLATYGTISATP